MVDGHPEYALNESLVGELLSNAVRALMTLDPTLRREAG